MRADRIMQSHGVINLEAEYNFLRLFNFSDLLNDSVLRKGLNIGCGFILNHELA